MRSALPVALCAAAFTGAALIAQTPAGGLEQKLTAKLAEAWVKNADWSTDFAAAKAAAARSGKPIFAYFTRSYAP